MSLPITALPSVRLQNVGTLSARSTEKAQASAALVKTSSEVSIQSRNAPMALLTQASVNGISDAFKPASGDSAIQGIGGQSSAGGRMADLIMSLVAKLFETFKAQHEGEDEDAMLKDFMARIRDGFGQGSKEAMDLLKGMGVLTDEMAADITQIFATVQQGFADFETAQSNRINGTASVA